MRILDFVRKHVAGALAGFFASMYAAERSATRTLRRRLREKEDAAVRRRALLPSFDANEHLACVVLSHVTEAKDRVRLAAASKVWYRASRLRASQPEILDFRRYEGDASLDAEDVLKSLRSWINLEKVPKRERLDILYLDGCDIPRQEAVFPADTVTPLDELDDFTRHDRDYDDRVWRQPWFDVWPCVHCGVVTGSGTDCWGYDARLRYLKEHPQYYYTEDEIDDITCGGGYVCESCCRVRCSGCEDLSCEACLDGLPSCAPGGKSCGECGVTACMMCDDEFWRYDSGWGECICRECATSSDLDMDEGVSYVHGEETW